MTGMPTREAIGQKTTAVMQRYLPAPSVFMQPRYRGLDFLFPTCIALRGHGMEVKAGSRCSSSLLGKVGAMRLSKTFCEQDLGGIRWGQLFKRICEQDLVGKRWGGISEFCDGALASTNAFSS